MIIQIKNYLKQDKTRQDKTRQDRQTHTKTDTHTDRHTDTHTDRQTDRHTDKQRITPDISVIVGAETLCIDVLVVDPGCHH